jgi:predicted sulfurtransferase
MLDKEGEEAPLVLDIRNKYEWDIGHFKGSQRPEFHKFRQVSSLLVFNRFYRLEIQPVMLVYSTPLTFSLVSSPLPRFPV